MSKVLIAVGLTTSVFAAAGVQQRSAPSGLVLRQVIARPILNPTGSPSPDSRLLSSVDPETGDLAVQELDTGRIRRLTRLTTEGEQVSLSAWSRDGRQSRTPLTRVAAPPSASFGSTGRTTVCSMNVTVNLSRSVRGRTGTKFSRRS